MSNSEHIIALQEKLTRCRGEYYKLVWLAGGTAAARTELLLHLKNTFYTDLGQELSATLLDIPVQQRPISLVGCLDNSLAKVRQMPTCLDHIEILFEPSLKVNPVATIQNASRHAPIIASWPGEKRADSLVFGPPRHPAYTQLDLSRREAIVHLI